MGLVLYLLLGIDLEMELLKLHPVHPVHLHLFILWVLLHWLVFILGLYLPLLLVLP